MMMATKSGQTPTILPVVVLMLIAVRAARADFTETLRHPLLSTPIVTEPELKNLINAPSMMAVYFQRHEFEPKLVGDISSFYLEYDIAAKYLQLYNVTLVVFDCDTDKTDEALCKKDAPYIFTFRSGQEVERIKVTDYHTDAYTLQAKILLLILKDDVPVVRSRSERQEVMKNAAGSWDVILVYLEHLSGPEFRIFAEIAYFYKDQFKLMVTTEPEVTYGLLHTEKIGDKQQDALMWLLYCSDTSKGEITEANVCQNIKYLGEFELEAIVHFLQQQNLVESTVFTDENCEMTSNPDRLPTDLDIYYVFYDNYVKTIPGMDYMSQTFRGQARIVLINIDEEACRNVYKAQSVEGNIDEYTLPVLSVKHVSTYKFMELEKSEKTDEDFHEKINRFLRLGLKDGVDIQDDEVAHTVYDLDLEKKDIDELDLVPELSRLTFRQAVKSADTSVVLFYLPFDPIGKVLLTTFIEAAKQLGPQDILARVDCFDATDVCTAENITTFPIVKIYQAGRTEQVYDGHLDLSSIVETVHLLQLKSPIELKSVKDVNEFMSGSHPVAFSEFTPSSVLLLASANDQEVIQTFKDVSETASPFAPFAYVLNQLAEDFAEKYQVSLPSIIAKNRKDPIKPLRKLSSDLKLENVIDFVIKSKAAFIPELTLQNFPSLRAKQIPLTILFVELEDSQIKTAMEIFTAVATSGKHSNTAFCWMAAGADSVGREILSEYNATAAPPVVTVVDFHNSAVYTNDVSVFHADHLSDWLSQVLSGSERPSKSLEKKKWTPGIRPYDFLKKIDAKSDVHPMQKPTPEKGEEDLDTPSSELHFQYDHLVRLQLLKKKHSLKNTQSNQDDTAEDDKSRDSATPVSVHAHEETTQQGRSNDEEEKVAHIEL